MSRRITISTRVWWRFFRSFVSRPFPTSLVSWVRGGHGERQRKRTRILSSAANRGQIMSVLVLGRIIDPTGLIRLIGPIICFCSFSPAERRGGREAVSYVFGRLRNRSTHGSTKNLRPAPTRTIIRLRTWPILKGPRTAPSCVSGSLKNSQKVLNNP